MRHLRRPGSPSPSAPLTAPVLAGLVTAATALTLPAATEAQELEMDRLSGMEARSIGPAAMSGRVAAVEGVPGDPSTIYVGAATGGLWKTTDAGTTWEPIFDEQDASSIGAIRVHPANPDLVWVGTGETNLRNSSGVGRGVYRSRDGGETWEHVGLEDSEHIHRIVVHPADPDVAYVAAAGPLWASGGQRGVYRTTDGGESWERVLAGSNLRTGAADLVMDPRNPSKLIASLWEFRRWPHFFESGGPGSGLHVTHDGGETWKERTSGDGLPEGPLGRIGLAVAPSDPEIVYAIVEARESVLLRSEDGGESWETVNSGDAVADRPFYYHDLEVDPQRPDRLYYVHGTLEVSTDGGESFEGVATWGGGVHVDHHALWIDPEDPDFVVDGNDGGVYVSRDRAGSWRFVENLPLAQFYEIDVDRGTPYHVYGGLQDNGSWRGPSEVWEQGGIRNYHWTEIGFGDGFGALDDPEDPRYGFSMSQRGFLVRYDLVTGNRRDIRPAPPSDSLPLRFNWNAPIALDPHRENTVYFGSQFVHRSTDDGLSWQIVSPDLTTDSAAWQRQEESGGLTKDVTGAENYTTLYAIAPSPLEEGVIWTGSDDGLLHVTRDGGETWTEVGRNLPGEVPDHAWISHVDASEHDPAAAHLAIHAYMQGDWAPYVYTTDDYGRSWERLAREEQVDGFARVVEQDPVVPSIFYLGTEFGLFVTIDGGESWTKWTNGVPTVPVRALAIQPREHDLVLGTHGRGVFVLDDLTPLRALAADPSLVDRRLHLFDPAPAIVHDLAAPKVYRFSGNAMFSGENEPYGAGFTYVANLPEPATGEEAPTATDEPGGPPMAPPAAGEPPGPATGETEEETKSVTATLQVLQADSVIREIELEPDTGLNRATWDLRRKGWTGLTESGETDEDDTGTGPEALPGSYRLRLVAGADTATAPLEVRPDPRVAIPLPDRREKLDALMETGELIELSARAVNRIRDTRGSVDRVLELVADRKADADEEDGGADPTPGSPAGDGTGARNGAPTTGVGIDAGAAVLDSLRETGRELRERLTEVEEIFTGPTEEVQGITRSADDVRSKLFRAYGSLGSSYHAPTSTQRRLVSLARRALEEALPRVNELFATEVEAFRRQVEEAGLSFFQEREPLEMP